MFPNRCEHSRSCAPDCVQCKRLARWGMALVSGEPVCATWYAQVRIYSDRELVREMEAIGEGLRNEVNFSPTPSVHACPLHRHDCRFEHLRKGTSSARAALALPSLTHLPRQ